MRLSNLFPILQYWYDPRLLLGTLIVLLVAFWAGWGSRIRYLAAGSAVCVLLYIAGLMAGGVQSYLINAIGMLPCAMMPAVLLGLWGGKLVSLLRRRSAPET